MTSDPERVALGKRLKALRERRGLSQEKLAERLEWDRLKIVKVEGGYQACAQSKTRRMLSEALDVPFDEFDRYLDGQLALDTLLRRASAASKAA